MGWARRLLDVVDSSLVTKVERDHSQPDSEFRRRRIVVALVLVVGAVLLAVSLGLEPGDPAFYGWTMLVALTWVVGGLLSGPLHLGRTPSRGRLRRPVLSPVLLGLAAAAAFAVGALVVRQIPPLAGYVDQVLAHADAGYLPLIAAVTLVNGVAEEIFFRGGLFAAIGRRRPVLISTLVYGVATVATGNVMLVFAALVLGVVLGLQRRASGGVLAPILTHVTWSSVMLFVLPPLFG
ncbi:CPBP family intramembrane glutamic endopeptidase [Jannaschia sp. R86511]|uniref:CPBP family intramembrane glutamic endopeptidase n=1 Tax=Jannaschia sp. R86511 TaxID=3093853 RepID=UPI0036D360C9